MKPTTEDLQQQFDALNKQCFGGQLPKVRIQLSKARTYLGQLGYKRRRKLLGGWEYYDYVIRISIRLEHTEDEITDTLLHEMIHLYISVNHLKDTSTHGVLFRKIMNELNTRYGRHITVSHHRTKEELEQDQEGAAQAWDELEKSVVSKIADDVKVRIQGRRVEMIILKKVE